MRTARRSTVDTLLGHPYDGDGYLSEVTVRRLAQRAFLSLAAIIVASLPALATPAAPMGVVTGANKAMISQVPAIDGTSIYDGDVVSTGTTGMARLRIGASQIVLAGETSIKLNKLGAGAKVTLVQGMVR